MLWRKVSDPQENQKEASDGIPLTVRIGKKLADQETIAWQSEKKNELIHEKSTYKNSRDTNYSHSSMYIPQGRHNFSKTEGAVQKMGGPGGRTLKMILLLMFLGWKFRENRWISPKTGRAAPVPYFLE